MPTATEARGAKRREVRVLSTRQKIVPSLRNEGTAHDSVRCHRRVSDGINKQQSHVGSILHSTKQNQVCHGKVQCAIQCGRRRSSCRAASDTNQEAVSTWRYPLEDWEMKPRLKNRSGPAIVNSSAETLVY